ncbi:MAG: copper chaperone PCu(A)C [Proteobacteria bacterium]|nr:copper chaperone PCu(A)C [Pseudomonadota bacterium]MDA1058663.1 copper chaperone PCu(A)C [Pseudomonadota bacterium]
MIAAQISRIFCGLAAAVLFAVVPAEAQEATTGELRISGGWVRESIGPTPTGAAYMEFHNAGTRTITLTGATSPAADTVVLHATTRDGDILRMRPIDSLAFRPGETVSLAPGGHHFMFTGVKTPFRSGMSVDLTFTFSDGRTITVAAPVRRIQSGGVEPHHGQGDRQ